MSWYVNLKTNVKLLIGFGFVLALLTVVGVLAIQKLGEVDEGSNVIAGVWLPSTRLAGVMKATMIDTRLKEYGHVVMEDVAAKQAREAELASLEKTLTEAFRLYEPTIASEEERRLVEKLAAQWDAYRKDHAATLSASRAGDPAAKELLLARRESFNAANALADELIELNVTGGKAASDAATATYHSARTVIIAILLIALIVGLGLALLIGRIVSRPLVRAVDVLKAVADGDFTRSLDVDTKDEVGDMARSLNLAVSRMRTALTEVRASADTTASSSQQLQSASTEISQGAQEQASSLEETAASLEEMTATVRQNAENAKQANQLAAGARDVADKGSSVVTDAVRAMAEINDSSKKIADIITTIDEIAFQTNLLALNAAVEAARAGQQGRGFAVVAGEVRKLAARSASAAKEIKTLIQDSTEKVSSGTDLVTQSGRTLDEIVVSVKRVADIVGEIAAASREQATGIEQVNRAVTQMDQVTQANASQTEELASTAEALSSQAEQLQALVGRFKLDSDDGFSSAQAAPRVAAAAPRPRRAVRVKPVAAPAAHGNGHGNGHANRIAMIDLDSEKPVDQGAYVEY